MPFRGGDSHFALAIAMLTAFRRICPSTIFGRIKVRSVVARVLPLIASTVSQIFPEANRNMSIA